MATKAEECSEIKTVMDGMDLSFIETAQAKLDKGLKSSTEKHTSPPEADENTDRSNVAEPIARSKPPKKRSKAPKQTKTKEEKGSATRKKRKTKSSASTERVSDDLLRQLVYDYLKDKNRPFNCVTLYQNLNKKVGNTQLKVFLAKMVNSGQLQEKAYGKTSIFWISQSEIVGEDVDLKALNEESKGKRETLKVSVRESQQAVETQQQQNATLRKVLSNAAIAKKIAKLKMETASKSTKIEELQAAPSLDGAKAEQCHPVDPIELKEQIKYYMSLWRQRQQNAFDILEGISEATGKSVTLLQEQAGMEGDHVHNLPTRAPRSVDELIKHCREEKKD